MGKKLEEMIPAPVEVERSIKNVVGSESIISNRGREFEQGIWPNC